MGFFARNALILIWKKIGRSDAKRLAGQTPAPGVAGDCDICYIDDGHPMHMLDVYYPEGTDGPLPVIFDIHGGGWMYGNKDLNRNYCLALASRGFAVVNISYRLLPETNLAGQVSDIFAALGWLGEHGGKHHCDLGRVYLTGDSAGGHLSTLVTAISVEPALLSLYSVKKLSFTIKAVAATHTAPDVCRKMFGLKPIDKEIRRMLFGRKPETNLLFYKSTIYSAAKPETYPPVLVVSSEADQLYPHSVKLIGYLEEKGFRYETAIAEPDPKSGHVFNVTYPDREDGRLMNDRIAAYFHSI